MKHPLKKVEEFIASLESARGIPGRLTPIARDMLVDLVEEYKDSKKLVISQAQAMNGLISNLDNLKEENKKLIEALEFYANSEWNDNYPGGITYEGKKKHELFLDTGQIARKALEGK